jgi:uncharacterized protein (TIGR01244 family)
MMSTKGRQPIAFEDEMPQFRKVTDSFQVSPQITPDEAREAVASGVVLIINNRPEGESPDQTPIAEIEAVARAGGADFISIPFVGRPTDAQAKAQAEAVANAKGPVLAYCRSGTRSITAWALGEAAAGGDREELIRMARNAGYDLAPILRG